MNYKLVLGKSSCSHRCFENSGSGKSGNISTNVDASEEVFCKTFTKTNLFFCIILEVKYAKPYDSIFSQKDTSQPANIGPRTSPSKVSKTSLKIPFEHPRDIPN